MSTFAFADEGLLVDGPSVARAFLHALARKLHCLAVRAKETFTKALQGLSAIPRLAIEIALTSVAAVRARSGFGAAVSLVVTGGQVVGYAVRALAFRVSALAEECLARMRQVAKSLPTLEVPASLKAQARALSKNPWIAAVIVMVAVLDLTPHR